MRKSILWFERFYYAYHDYYIDTLNTYTGDSSSLINSLTLLHPENFITVWQGDPLSSAALFNISNLRDPQVDAEFILGNCGDSRLYFQFFLSSDAERDAARQHWSQQSNWKIWQYHQWSHRRTPCKVTSILPLEWTLRRPFGETWSPPKSTVHF